jgi:hypothetical protein
MEDDRPFRCERAEIARSRIQVPRYPKLRHFGLARAAARLNGRQKVATAAGGFCPAPQVPPGHRPQTRLLTKRRNRVPDGECGPEDQQHRARAAHQSIRRRRFQGPAGLPMSLGAYSWWNTPTILLCAGERRCTIHPLDLPGKPRQFSLAASTTSGILWKNKRIMWR